METSDRAGHGEYKIPGGKLVVVDLAVSAGRIAEVQVSGDFFLEPATALDTINAALVGLAADADAARLAAAVSEALEPDTQLYGISPEGVAVAVRRALDPASGAEPTP
ncbi:MAG TPA: biotin--protein ligase [Luteimonas sp.]